MKKKIYISLCVIGICTALITALCTLLIFYDFFNTKAINDLKNQGDILINCIDIISDSSDENLRNKIIKSSSYNLRITIINPDGKVVYDSLT
ncbi:MAG: Single Cache-like, partial [Clostridia bacterium]|nr:Single Cache-like [Clostridia bacterium]